MFEKDMRFPRLLDVYGALLSDRKRELLEYYYNEDYSLAEISELTGISRQGVRDSIRKSQEEINCLEDRLHLAERAEYRGVLLNQLTEALEAVPDAREDVRIHELIGRLRALDDRS
jgi:predicted DNA-binding protein YlxM (UPF0122 family)